jgi:hypothetical protein
MEVNTMGGVFGLDRNWGGLLGGACGGGCGSLWRRLWEPVAASLWRRLWEPVAAAVAETGDVAEDAAVMVDAKIAS